MKPKNAYPACAAVLVAFLSGCASPPDASIAVVEDKGGPLNLSMLISKEGHETAYLKDALPGPEGFALVPGFVWEGETLSRDGERCTAVTEKILSWKTRKVETPGGALTVCEPVVNVAKREVACPRASGALATEPVDKKVKVAAANGCPVGSL